jgi:hypothetical protein
VRPGREVKRTPPTENGYRADRGEIVLAGRRAVITSPEEALRSRIGMERHRDDVETVACRFGLAVDLTAPVGSLSLLDHDTNR